MLDLEPIKARYEAATPGPLWRWDTYPSADDGRPCPSLIGAHGYGILSCDGEMNGPKMADADLIANAPTDIAALIAEVERLREILSDVSASTSKWGHPIDY